MREPEVLLVFPQLMVFDLEVERSSSNIFPLGLAYLAGSLQASGIAVRVADMVTDRMDLGDLRLLLRQTRPDVVGVAVTTVSYPRARQVAQTIKAELPGSLVVFGGVHVTVAYREVLEEAAVDVAVIGEGEETMVELVKAHRAGQPLDGIKGIAVRRDGRAVTTPRRPFVRDLDTLPMPAVHPFAPTGKLHDRYDVYPVCSGRGCTYACRFCAAGALSGRAYRTCSPARVIAEMKLVARDFGANQFFIVDDTFTAIPERAYEICRLIQQELPGARWLCECRTNSVSPHLLRAMAESGCYKLQFGVESGNQAILNTVLKGTTLEQIERAVTAAYEANITEVVGSFIIGLPGDTYQSCLETIAFALKLKGIAEGFTQRTGTHYRFLPFLASLIPFPKTACTDMAGELGIDIVRQDPHAFISDDILTHPSGMSAQEIRELVMLGELVLQNLHLPGVRFGIDLPQPAAEEPLAVAC